jgi:hypothetical protein
MLLVIRVVEVICRLFVVPIFDLFNQRVIGQRLEYL